MDIKIEQKLPDSEGQVKPGMPSQWGHRKSQARIIMQVTEHIHQTPPPNTYYEDMFPRNGLSSKF